MIELMKHPRTTIVHKLEHTQKAIWWRVRKVEMPNKKIKINDEDTIMDHADFDYLSWKEILSLIDDYYKVNSFLVEECLAISELYTT
jgi:hypothetical protein